LTLIPKAERNKVWNGVLYLGGIDLIGNPDEYLFTKEDIIIAMTEKL
jgi:hypothetical protein